MSLLKLSYFTQVFPFYATFYSIVLHHISEDNTTFLLYYFYCLALFSSYFTAHKLFISLSKQDDADTEQSCMSERQSESLSVYIQKAWAPNVKLI